MTAAATQRKKILVVDDEPTLRRTLRANLLARGYEVALAETGEDALAQATARLPDLVILDLMLPSAACPIGDADPGALGPRRGADQGARPGHGCR